MNLDYPNLKLYIYSTTPYFADVLAKILVHFIFLELWSNLINRERLENLETENWEDLFYDVGLKFKTMILSENTIFLKGIERVEIKVSFRLF